MVNTSLRRALLQWGLSTPLWALPDVSGARVQDAAECIAPAKAGGGFDLTCKLVGELVALSGAPAKPLLVSYLPGGIGAVAYDRMVTQRLHIETTLP